GALAGGSVPTWERPGGFRRPACFTWNTPRASAGRSVHTCERGSGVGEADGFTGERGQACVSLTGRPRRSNRLIGREGVVLEGEWGAIFGTAPHPGLRPPLSTNSAWRGALGDGECSLSHGRAEICSVYCLGEEWSMVVAVQPSGCSSSVTAP